MLKKWMCIFLLAFFVGMTAYGNCRAEVIKDSLRITDVTPVQFCAVWGTSEPASGWVSVFLDPGATTPYTGAVVISESAQHSPAESIGVMKVKVVGLKPDTEYFFQTETVLKRDNSVHLSPIQGVRTEKSSTIVRNDVLALNVSSGGTQPPIGALVIASLDEASYPISSWVGDGVPEQWGAIDTNNLYDKQTHTNLELQGGEVIYLMLFAGSLGSVETQETVPAETGVVQPLKALAILPSSGPTPTPPPASAAEGGGGGCFIKTMLE